MNFHIDIANEIEDINETIADDSDDIDTNDNLKLFHKAVRNNNTALAEKLLNSGDVTVYDKEKEVTSVNSSYIYSYFSMVIRHYM